MASVRAVSYILRARKTSLLGIPGLSFSFSHPNKTIINFYSSQKSMTKIDETDSSGSKVQTTLAEVVKKNTESAWYASVIVAGVGVTALMFYAIFRELFSSKSPNSVYAKAVERCSKDERVLNALGEPIKAYGEESRRGRRQHVSHTVFLHNNKTCMRMIFYIQGQRKHGTVHLEVRENDDGKFEYRYLFIQLDDLMHTVLVLEDNRASEIKTNNISSFTLPAASLPE